MKQLISRSILSGICISIGATLFLVIDNKIIGSLFFSLGLLTIVKFNLNLYTGKVGYLFDKNNQIHKYPFHLPIIALFNIVGTYIYGIAIRYTTIYPLISEKCNTIVNNKEYIPLYSLLFLSIMTGILMYVGVEAYKKSKDNLSIIDNLIIIGCVSAFILCGFEHSIAYSAYCSIVNNFNIPNLLIMLIGNGIGSNLFYFLSKE